MWSVKMENYLHIDQESCENDKISTQTEELLVESVYTRRHSSSQALRCYSPGWQFCSGQLVLKGFVSELSVNWPLKHKAMLEFMSINIILNTILIKQISSMYREKQEERSYMSEQGGEHRGLAACCLCDQQSDEQSGGWREERVEEAFIRNWGRSLDLYPANQLRLCFTKKRIIFTQYVSNKI